jgi:outer membrane receptor protein involved in Fe transport
LVKSNLEFATHAVARGAMSVRPRWALALSATCSAIALVAGAAPGCAWAADAADVADAAPKTTAGTDVQEVIVNGVPYKETVLPTRLQTNSVYGLDLNVMDTPRNTTLLSTTQLNTLNIKDPRAFSYLTSSSYSDSSFGTPNIPRIRGQYADVFINGMRNSFTQNGYGAPPNFDSIENIAITKGPASVIDGPGAGVGGSVDLLTKRPKMNGWNNSASVTWDSIGNRRAVVDIGGAITPGSLAFILSYSGEDSKNDYFQGHWMRKNAVYGAVRWIPNDQYQLDFNAEVNVQQYTENVGVNRVNQALINNHTYLQGGPDGKEFFSTLIGSPPIPIGSPGNPYSPVVPILTETLLTNSTPFNLRTTIDQTEGTSSLAKLYNAQLIQSYHFDNGLTLENNTFFAYQNSDNREYYYYADSSRGSYSIESRTDLKGSYDVKFGGLDIRNDMIGGFTFRFARVNYISDFNVETVSVYDLTSNPALWKYDNAYHLAYGDAFLYKSSFGRTLFGVPGRDDVSDGNSGISKVYDWGLFFQDRVEFSPEWSLLFGGRIDALKAHSYDPLGGVICDSCFNDLPQSRSTGWYGDGNVNLSLVWRPQSWVSAYATFNWTQSVNPNGGEGGINAYGQVPDSRLLRGDSYLYEAGLKFNLLDEKLFAGAAVFDQKRNVAVGQGNTGTDAANIRGVELEANYQPSRNFFATASYSYVKTTLNSPAPFYDYPAELGINIDGAGTFAVFKTGQKFDDPGVPKHVFNTLANYKFDNGVGIRGGVQVTGPIETSTSGVIDLAASLYVPQSVIDAGGVYKSPVIPWQYTANAAVFYQFDKYTVTLSIYNLTNQKNWQPSPTFYGNDFVVLQDPRTVEVRLEAKF